MLPLYRLQAVLQMARQPRWHGQGEIFTHAGPSISPALARAVARRTRLESAAVVLTLDASGRAALQQAGSVRCRLARTRGIAPVLFPPLFSIGRRGCLTCSGSFRLCGCRLSNALARRVE